MFYKFASIALRILMLALSDLKVNGLQNVPPSGPLIVVANHLNFFDPPLVGTIMPRTVVFMAKEELFQKPLSRLVVQSYGAFPVKRNKPDRRALSHACGILERGQVLGLFPEGRRSPLTGLARAEAGISLIATRSGAPILPVAITGTEAIAGKTWIVRRPKISVKIGSPFHLPAVEKRIDGATLTEFADHIMCQVAELLPPRYRGVYADMVADAASGEKLAPTVWSD